MKILAGIILCFSLLIVPTALAADNSSSSEVDMGPYATPNCIIGGLNNTPTVVLVWTGDQAVASVKASICGESGTFTYSWNGGPFTSNYTYNASPGQNVTVTVNITTADLGLVGTVSASGTAPLTGGTGGPPPPPPPPPPVGSPPVVESLGVNNVNPVYGSTVYLNYTVANNPTSCSVTGGYSGSVTPPPDGSTVETFNVGAIGNTAKTYNLTCSNSLGTSNTLSITVTPVSAGGQLNGPLEEACAFSTNVRYVLNAPYVPNIWFSGQSICTGDDILDDQSIILEKQRTANVSAPTLTRPYPTGYAFGAPVLGGAVWPNANALSVITKYQCGSTQSSFKYATIATLFITDIYGDEGGNQIASKWQLTTPPYSQCG